MSAIFKVHQSHPVMPTGNSSRLPIGRHLACVAAQWQTAIQAVFSLTKLYSKPVRSSEKFSVFSGILHSSTLQHPRCSCHHLQASGSFLFLSRLSPGCSSSCLSGPVILSPTENDSDGRWERESSLGILAIKLPRKVRLNKCGRKFC